MRLLKQGREIEGWQLLLRESVRDLDRRLSQDDGSLSASKRAKLKSQREFSQHQLENTAEFVAVVEGVEILFWAKIIAPLDTSLKASFASQDLKFWKELIGSAAEQNDKEFFVELGKFLAGERKPLQPFDNIDRNLAHVLHRDPSINTKDGLRVLKELGTPICGDCPEENFRVRKSRLLRRFSAGLKAGPEDEVRRMDKWTRTFYDQAFAFWREKHSSQSD